MRLAWLQAIGHHLRALATVQGFIALAVVLVLGGRFVLPAIAESLTSTAGSLTPAVLPRSEDGNPADGVFIDGDSHGGAGDPGTAATPESPMSPASVMTPATPASPATPAVEMVELRLNGDLFDGMGAEFGKAEFRFDEDGRLRFEVDVEDLADLGFAEGDVFSVFVDGMFVGHITLVHGDDVSGELKLDTDDGDQVMAVEAGKMVTVKDGDGNVVLTSTLAATPVSPASPASPASAASPATVASPVTVASPAEVDNSGPSLNSGPGNAEQAMSPVTAASPVTVASPADVDNSGPGNAEDGGGGGGHSGRG